MIPVLFNILFFLIPLIFYKNTSELFEFNKIVTLYAVTTIITSIWIINSISARKIIFKKTILDWPLVGYLVVLLLSTLLSIDPRTSWLGYYGRFNGGLVSQICYALLYWAYVSNMNAKQAKQTVIFGLLSVAIASILGVLEHFGIFATCGLMKLGWTESCWVQDVKNRVFSTLGQPNWLAAVLVALLPISLTLSLKNSAYNLLSILFFVTLLFTKSRSGLLAFGIEFIILWSFIYFQSKSKYIDRLTPHLVIFCTLALLFLFKPITVKIGTSYQPQLTTTSNGPALETGGTESGTIRKYVWSGAWNIFNKHPILGTGPETFAFAFPERKPIEHNLTSEWDFVYNKAHNEFLNYLATTGVLGLISYLIIICYSVIVMIQARRFDLLAGYTAISVTNFFGFSVVPVSILFFLFPAIAIVSNDKNQEDVKYKKLEPNHYLTIAVLLLVTFYGLHTIYQYWRADIHYNTAKTTNNIDEINKAIAISPNEPNFVTQLSFITTDTETSLKALALNPYNQNSRKILISNLVKNEKENPENLFVAENILLDGITISPKDPRLYYQLGILQLKIGKNEDGIKNLEKSVQLKPNYKEGRFTLGTTYFALKQNEKAKEQFEYILKNIDPNDELTKKYLEESN